MALDAATGAVVAEQGETTMRASFVQAITLDGDDAYTAAAGSALQDVVRTITGLQVTLSAVTGYLITAAGAMTHIAHYDRAADELHLFAIADGAEPAGPVDFSNDTLHLLCFGE